jgi:hypothetical protein
MVQRDDGPWFEKRGLWQVNLSPFLSFVVALMRTSARRLHFLGEPHLLAGQHNPTFPRTRMT